MPAKEDILKALHDLEEEIRDLEEALNTKTHKEILQSVHHYSTLLMEEQASLDGKMDIMEKSIPRKQKQRIPKRQPILLK